MLNPENLFVAGVYVPDVLFGGYILALAGLFVVVMRDVIRAVFRNPLQRTVGTLAAVYVAQISYILAMGGTGQEFAFIALDGAAAAVILFRPAGWAQAMIGLTYLLEMSMHAAKAVLSSSWMTELLGLGPAGFNPMAYWWFLMVAGAVQLLIAGGWWHHVRARNRPALRAASTAGAAVRRKGAQG
jgi:hypothetical protein